jgi:hypothetical protein
MEETEQRENATVVREDRDTVNMEETRKQQDATRGQNV